MENQFRLAHGKAGLAEDLVLYCGRHDYATRVLSNTANLAAVMRTTGPKDVRTAMQYQHPELEIVRAALNQASESALQTSGEENLWHVLGHRSKTSTRQIVEKMVSAEGIEPSTY